MQTIFNIFWGVVGVAITCGIAAMGLSTPTPYGFAKFAFVTSAVFFAALVYLWGIFSENDRQGIKLWIGLPGVVLPVITIPVLFWYIDVRVERSLLEFAAMDISDASTAALKTRASHLIDRINDFQLTSEQTIMDILESYRYYDPKNTNADEQRLRFQEKSRRLLSESARQNSEWRRNYLPEVLAIISIVKERFQGVPEPDNNARPALEGMLAGVAPVSEAAKYLSIVASKLPN